MAPATPLVIQSLRGGLNDQDPPNLLKEDECETANNVEFFWSALGERRWGCDPLNLDASNLTDENRIVHISQWYPDNDVTSPEFWGIGATPGTSVTIAKRSAGVWSEVTPVDPILSASPNIYFITSRPGPASLSPLGKLFWFYDSGVDRTHVWDPNNGPTLRRTGLAQPNPPTVGNGIVFAVPATPRFYRIRIVRQAGLSSQVTVRSEPSTSVAFTPDGVHAPRITRPTLPGESETHWEVEGSFDDATFYRIQSLAIATTFWDDTFTDPSSFAEEGFLSDAIGSYLLIPSAKYGDVDGDRLVMSGHWSDTSLMSTVWWTPTYTSPGAGNDERVPIVTTGGLPIVSNLSLDNYAGGPITGQSTAISGAWYVFKWSRIYKMNRTDNVTQAYRPMTISTSRGAIPNSIFAGIDENGAPCINFLDPLHGPSRIGTGGIQTIRGVRKTWNRVNLNATVVAHGLYYPYKQQAHWWLALEDSNFPNFKLVSQVSEYQTTTGGDVGRGWSTADGRSTEAYCSAVLTELVTVSGVTALRDRPFIGLSDPDFIQRCDHETIVTDAGEAYIATTVTSAFMSAGLLRQWGAMTTALLASANPGTSVAISIIRNFGREETRQYVVDLTPGVNETNVPFVFRFQNSLALSESVSLQFKFSDVI